MVNPAIAFIIISLLYNKLKFECSYFHNTNMATSSIMNDDALGNKLPIVFLHKLPKKNLYLI